MKVKTNGVEVNKYEEANTKQKEGNLDIGKRLDLNTLLKRLKNQESEKKKINFIIILSLISLVVVILAFLSLQ